MASAQGPWCWSLPEWRAVFFKNLLPCLFDKIQTLLMSYHPHRHSTRTHPKYLWGASNVEVERTATGRTSRAVALAWSSLTTHAAHTRRQTQSPDATGTSLCPPGASKSTARHTHRRRDTATWLLPGRGTRSRTRRTRLSTPEHCSAPQPCPSAPLPPRAPLPSEGPPPKRQDCRSAP